VITYFPPRAAYVKLPPVTPPLDARQRILSAALELFSERGFAATTTAAIAQRADVAEKTLFAHFKSKNQLFESTLSPAVLELTAPELVTDVIDTLGGSWEHFDQVLRALLTNRVEFATKHRAKVKLIIQEVLLRPELFSRFLAEGERVMPSFAALIGRFETSGEVRRLPRASVLRIILSMAVGYFVTRAILLPEPPGGGAWNDKQEIDTMVSVLTEGIKARAPVAKKKSKTSRRAGELSSRANDDGNAARRSSGGRSPSRPSRGAAPARPSSRSRAR